MPNMPSPSASAVPATAGSFVTPRAALAVVTSVFFMWGFLTCLNDILIPHLKAVFELNYARAMLVQFTFFGAYFLMSLPAGRIVARVGYKRGIVIGLMVAGVGALGFWPAAELRLYEAFLCALFVLATGITILQVSANPYVALLGPEETSSSRLTLAQALNSLGTTLAPFFGGFLILSNAVRNPDQIAALSVAEQATYRAQEAQAVQGPYVGLAIALFVLAILVQLFRLPALEGVDTQSGGPKATLRQALSHRHVVLGILGIFFYVGAEVSIGSLMVNYFALPEVGGLSERQAANYLGAYWSLAMVGRFFGSALMVRISPRKLLAIAGGINMLLLAFTLGSSGTTAIYSLVAVGLFNSIMFPTIFALSIERLGPLTNQASSLLIMAIVGGAIIPFLQGTLADHIGLPSSFILPLLCYGYVVFYGIWSMRAKSQAAH